MSKDEATTDPYKETETPNKSLAVKISEMNNYKTNHLTGVLLTIIDASFPDSEQINSMKSLIRREIYNDQQERVSAIHSIVSRAEVTAFREHPTLDEQVNTRSFDHMVFDKYEQ